MSDYDQSRHSRDFPQSRFDTGSSGSWLGWVLGGVAILGLIVLLSSLGTGTTTTSHPGGAGEEPVTIAPANPGTAGSATIVE